MDAHVVSAGTVIVIDDDVALLRALQFSLEMEGYNVESHRGGETLDPNTLPADRACLVIDYFLPGRTGLQLLEGLRARGIDLPAVIITTHAGPVLRGIAEGLGAAIVEKPLLGPELSSAIQNLLSGHAGRTKKRRPAMPDTVVPLSRIVLELAREPGRPEGDAQERYVLVAPLGEGGHIDAQAWKAVAARCRVARESASGESSLGHLKHVSGGRWALHYDITGDRNDETGFRFETERFVPGEYVSIERDDGTHVFRVVVVQPLVA